MVFLICCFRSRSLGHRASAGLPTWAAQPMAQHVGGPLAARPLLSLHPHLPCPGWAQEVQAGLSLRAVTASAWVLGLGMGRRRAPTELWPLVTCQTPMKGPANPFSCNETPQPWLGEAEGRLAGAPRWGGGQCRFHPREAAGVGIVPTPSPCTCPLPRGASLTNTNLEPNHWEL